MDGHLCARPRAGAFRRADAGAPGIPRAASTWSRAGPRLPGFPESSTNGARSSPSG
jgi:hypothetical protein